MIYTLLTDLAIIQIYHATCHAEALSTSVAARLRGQNPSRSRSGTPDGRGNTPQPRGSPAKSDDGLLGTKRKAEDDDHVRVKDEPLDTPPMKKLAL